MTEETDATTAFVALAVAGEPASVPDEARSRLLSALEANRYLPFLRELSEKFDLPEDAMRANLASIDDPRAWIKGLPPIQGHANFKPGPALAPLRGGFVRMQSGAWLPRHRHTDRELTVVLEGELVDGDGTIFGPGDCIDMEPGSTHSVGVPEGKQAVVALLHGRVEMLPE